MEISRVLLFAASLAAAGTVGGGTAAFPVSAVPSGAGAIAAEPVQALCGPYRCFARPFWRYRSGAGFQPYRRFGFAPPPPRFAPFDFRRFGGGVGGYGGGFGPRPGGFRRF